MTTVGMGARLQLIREGGIQVIWLLALSTVGAVAQNLLGMGLAKAMGLDVRLGILAGAVSLAGGPATSLAFGPTFEKMGVAGATTAAFASATFGIVAAGLIGGYVGGWLIRRHGLKPAGPVHGNATSRKGGRDPAQYRAGDRTGDGHRDTAERRHRETRGDPAGLYRRDGGSGHHPQSGRSLPLRRYFASGSPNCGRVVAVSVHRDGAADAQALGTGRTWLCRCW